jgi:hypothetical protein
MATQIRIAKQTNACAYTKATNAKAMVRVVVVDVTPPSHSRWPFSLSASGEGGERLLHRLRG